MSSCVLLITQSKHLFFKKDGSLGHQQKAMDDKTSKSRVVHYLMLNENTKQSYYRFDRDYSEEKAMSFIEDAFADKSNVFIKGKQRKYPIQGVQKELVITKKIIKSFPGIPGFLAKKGVELFVPNSGFAIAPTVRQIKGIEEDILWMLFNSQKTIVVTSEVIDMASLIVCNKIGNSCKNDSVVDRIFLDLVDYQQHLKSISPDSKKHFAY